MNGWSLGETRPSQTWPTSMIGRHLWSTVVCSTKITVRHSSRCQLMRPLDLRNHVDFMRHVPIQLRTVAAPCANPRSCTSTEPLEGDDLRAASIEVIVIVTVNRVTFKEFQLMIFLVGYREPGRLAGEVMHNLKLQ